MVEPGQRDVAVHAMTYTASTPEGGLQAALVDTPADADSTPGCTAADYSAEVEGAVALIERGGCSFAEKQAAAAEAGAVGAIIYNNTEGALSGTLGEAGAGRVPTGGVTQAEGKALAADAAKGARVSLEIRQLQEERETDNLLAETRGGSADRTVMLGAHLDSVTEGAGINDNGSGSAKPGRGRPQPRRRHEPEPPGQARQGQGAAQQGPVRLVVGGGERPARLRALRRQALREAARADPGVPQLRHDRLAQRRPVRLRRRRLRRRRRGPRSRGLRPDRAGHHRLPGPPGQAARGHRLRRPLRLRPLRRGGHPRRMGTFTGAEGLKTKEQAKRYGGTAGEAYDPCYHSACDDLKNISMKAFDTNIDVIAHAVGTYAHDLSSLGKPVKQKAAPEAQRHQGEGRAHGHHHGLTE